MLVFNAFPSSMEMASERVGLRARCQVTALPPAHTLAMLAHAYEVDSIRVVAIEETARRSSLSRLEPSGSDSPILLTSGQNRHEKAPDICVACRHTKQSAYETII